MSKPNKTKPAKPTTAPPIPAPLVRAALYARFSSDNQREESIDAQARAIQDYDAMSIEWTR